MLSCEVCQILFFVFLSGSVMLMPKLFDEMNLTRLFDQAWVLYSFFWLVCVYALIFFFFFRDIVHWYYTVMQSQPSYTCCNNSLVCVLDIYKSFFSVYTLWEAFIYTSSNLYMHISKSAEIPSILTVTSIYKFFHIT